MIAGQVSYAYNVWNQMIKTTTAERMLSYTYNGEGRRVEKISNGQSTRYLYEYDNVVLETDGRGKQTARNLYGTNLLSRTIASDTVYYLYNGHADVTSLIDTTGRLRSTFDYDAFGTPIESTVRYYDQTGALTTSVGKIDSPYRYSGYMYDGESGLYYLNARYYDSKIARFLSEDTYRGRANDPLSLNLYTYGQNNPIQYYDPTGHMVLKVGSKGDDVKALQEKLIKAGANIKADGSFGPAIQKAVLDFQKAQGLKADGIVGNQTLTSVKTAASLASIPSYHMSAADKAKQQQAANSSSVGAIKGSDILMSQSAMNQSLTNLSALQKQKGGVVKTAVVENKVVITDVVLPQAPDGYSNRRCYNDRKSNF